MGGVVGGGGMIVPVGGRVSSLGPPFIEGGSGGVNAGEARKSGKARLSCQLCGRMFGQMEDLRRHFRTHTGEKPYTCPFCSYRAAVKSSVIRHARTIHGTATTNQTMMGV